jgi:hypothetical protein
MAQAGTEMAPDSVPLIDLENIAGPKARPATIAGKLDALIAEAGPGIPALASFPGSRITAEGTRILADRNVRLLKANGDKNAADNRLLKEAARLAAQGCTRFVVTSYDSAFAQVADLGTLEILIWAPGPRLADKYASRAARIHHVPRPGAKKAPAGPPARAAKPKTAPAPGPRAAPADQGPRGTSLPGAAAGPPGRTAAAAVAAGAGLLLGGVPAGAGAVPGAVLARRAGRAG